ncbi:MAG TPA: carbon-nitrogen hydrolase family protein [Anaerolineae bacterium]|nr:carbon-nitrogen hydrolase family protein [Anaerolineae bacterium]
MQRFVIACAQFAVTPMAVRENVQKIVAWVERAVQETSARLVVLPEAVTTGFTPDCPPAELWDRVDQLPGRMTEPVAAVARGLGVHVVLPTYERGPERGVVYNSAALFGPTGELLGVYRKTHLFPTERLSGGGWSTPGEESVVVETELANIGLTICYDGDFPELYRCEAIQGAEVIVRPAALLRSFEIWEMTNRARAYDNHVYIAACNAIGPDAGGNYYFGHSMIVSPIAQVLALARGTEEVIAADLDPDPIRYVTYGAQTPMIFDHLEDRNLAAYRDILTPARSRFEPARRIPQEGLRASGSEPPSAVSQY